MTTVPQHTDDPLARWRAAWPEALRCWGPSIRLGEPDLVTDRGAPAGALAWFDLGDVRAHVDLREVARLGLDADPLPVLAHEIGHHVLAPADDTGRARIVERCRRGLVDRDADAPLMANLWTDMLINDRLTRVNGLDMTGPYVASRRVADHDAHRLLRRHPAPRSASFDVYLRAYELLWSLPRDTLVPPVTPPQETDAGFLARHARVFARDPVGGAAGFAALLRAWLPEGTPAPDSGCHVVGDPNAAPDVAEDDSLAELPVHPALDPDVNPAAPDPETAATGTPGTPTDPADDQPSPGQAFGPADLEALYSVLGTTRDAAADWYVARARRHLVPFPVDLDVPESEPEWQGLETWELGDDLTDLDWTGTALRSPTLLPGLTTVRRVVEPGEGADPDERPVDLDLYVDSSGSMRPPRVTVSPAVLGATVLVLSALRAGARVRVTSWSGAEQVASSGEPGTDRDRLMTALLTFHGGGTVFPLPQLAAAHPAGGPPPGPLRRRCHIAVISDDGVSSMFGTGQPGLETVAAEALASAGGGGTLVLCVGASAAAATREMAGGYDVYAVEDVDDVVGFAREFAHRHWTPARKAAAR